MDPNIAAVVLAAGKGSRMKAPPSKNKVVFTLAKRPMISYTVETLRQVGFSKIIVVVGYACESVRQALGDSVTYAVQDNPEGTGHAVKVALPYLPTQCHTLISVYGDDSAFYSPQLIKTLIQEHLASEAAVSLVTLNKTDPTGLGRIIRNQVGDIIAIVEEKDATSEQKKIVEINTGLYCFNKAFIEKALPELKRNPVSGEFYLTDVISYAVKHRYKIHPLTWPSDEIWFGVNTPEQLVEAEMKMKLKYIK